MEQVGFGSLNGFQLALTGLNTLHVIGYIAICIALYLRAGQSGPVLAVTLTPLLALVLQMMAPWVITDYGLGAGYVALLVLAMLLAAVPLVVLLLLPWKPR